MASPALPSPRTNCSPPPTSSRFRYHAGSAASTPARPCCFRGPAGSTEFSPFVEYGDAGGGRLAGRRHRLRVERAAHAAARPHPRQRHGARRWMRPAFPRCSPASRLPHREGEGRRARARCSPTTWPASRAVRDGARAGGAHPHRRQRRLERRRGRARDPRAGRVRPRVRRAALRDGRGARRAARAGARLGHPDRRGRERAQGIRPARSGARRRCRPARDQGAAARRRARARSTSSREAGLPVVVSSALDTSVGLSMGAAARRGAPANSTTTAGSARPRCWRRT